MAAVSRISGASGQRGAERDGGDRRGQRQRRAGGGPVRQAFHRGDRLQRRRAQHQQVERAVLEVALEHPLQREQGGQRQRDPGEAGGDGGQALRRGSGRERHEGGDRGVEAQAPAAARRRRSRPAPARAERAAPAPSRRELHGARGDRQRIVHRGQHQAAARQVRRHQLAEQGAVLGVQRRQRLVEQPERRADWRSAAPAPGAAAGRRKDGARRDPARGSGPASAPPPAPPAVIAAGPAHLEAELVARGAAGLQPVLVAEQVHVAAARLVGLQRARGAAGRRSRPPPGAMNPAMARSRLVLPAPFGPVSATASPAASLQARSPANSSRSPRRTARRSTLRRGDHAADPRRDGAAHGRSRAPASMTPAAASRGPLSALRGARRDAVCPAISARPRNRFSGGLEQGRTPQMASIDSLKTRREITAGGKTYHYYSLRAAEDAGLAGISRLPVSLKVLLENQLRFPASVDRRWRAPGFSLSSRDRRLARRGERSDRQRTAR